MIEIVWRLEHEVLDREQVVGPLLDGICGVPGFEAAFYDVNGRDQWRGFDRVHAVVDALTQRSQWFRIASTDRASLAMVALGKHGEVPTMMMQLSGVGLGELDALTEGWGELFEVVGIAFGSVSSAAWRASLVEAGVVEAVGAGEGDGGGDVGMVQVWGTGAEPECFGEVLAIVDRCGAMRRYRRGALDVVVFGDKGKVVDVAHADALRKLCGLLVE